MDDVSLGRLQLRIMQVLWGRGRANAREITEALNAAGAAEPVAHSTVQTLLRQLEGKGAAGHEVVDRIFVFRPTVAEDQVRRSATRDLLERVFGGRAAGLAAHLLEEEELTREELDELRRLIDRQRGEG